MRHVQGDEHCRQGRDMDDAVGVVMHHVKHLQGNPWDWMDACVQSADPCMAQGNGERPQLMLALSTPTADQLLNAL